MSAASTIPSISTPNVPFAPGEFALNCEAYTHLGMRLEFVNRSPVGRQASIAVKNFGPSIGIGWVDGTPSSLSRRPAHFSDGSDILSIMISAGGRFRVDGVRGLDSGGLHGAVVLESSRASAVYALDDGNSWNVRIARASLDPLLTCVQEPLQRCLPGDNAGIRLLGGYLASLASLGQNCDLTLAELHIRDLALYALGVRGDTQALVRERGVQAARQSAVLTAIAKRAGEPGLDPARVAAELGMSVRYLHRLLEPTGRTFAEHLLERRLDRAAGMLRMPDCAHLKIGEIAAQSGFADISHFNRSFRRVFGDTPLGVRVAPRACRGGAVSRAGLNRRRDPRER